MTSALERFEALFDATYADLLAYAQRRCRSSQDAEDVVAETFAVAWRRIEELPKGPDARLWLFGTARLVRRNQSRTHTRQQNLLGRVRGWLHPRRSGGLDATVTERLRIERAFATLSSMDREVLQLSVWEELSAKEIALALEISPSAVWKRLQRARERLAEALEEDDDPPGSAVSMARTHREAAG